MLKRLKAQVSQVANEFPGVLNNSGTQSSRDHPVTSKAEDEEIEGLICPVCMTHFSTAELLTSHFESAHSEKSSSVSNPNYEVNSNASASTPQVFSTKEQEINELRTQLREEKMFSNRLKDDLHSIQSTIALASDVPEGEVPYLVQQIKVLTADKGMITKQFLELEKDSIQEKRQLEQIHRERGELMGKLKQMSGQLREMTDDVETLKISKEDLERELKTAGSDNRRYEVEVTRLEKMLDVRPSEDDVSVLRTELINAQKLMDEIAQEKDLEMKEQIAAIRNLSLEREKQHLMIETLQKRLNENEQKAEGSSDEVMKMTLEVSDVQEKLKMSMRENADLKAEGKQKGERISELQKKIDENIVELTECRENVARLESQVGQAEKAIEQSKGLNVNSETKLNALQEKLNTLIEEKKKYESDVFSFEEKAQKHSENVKSLEMGNMELTNELSSIGSLLEQERNLLTEKNSEIRMKEETIHSLKDELAQSEKKSSKLSNELMGRTELIENLTAQVRSLQENSTELMKKISEGEGGAKMAIKQLEEDKKKLAAELASCVVRARVNTEQLDTKVSELEKKLRNADAVEAEKEQKWKEEKEEMGRKVREGEDEVKRMAERFVEMEKEIEEKRQKSSDRMRKMKEIIDQKDKGASEMVKQIEELKQKTNEKERHVREKDAILEEKREKIEDAVRRLEDAEKKARELESMVVNGDKNRGQLEDDLKESRARWTESESTLEQLKILFETVSGQLREKEADIENLKKEIADKEVHWKTKREEFEQQLERNQEDNEEAALNSKRTHEEMIRERERADASAKQLEKSNEQCDTLKSSVDAMAAEIAEKTTEYNELKFSSGHLKSEKEDMSKVIDGLRIQLDEQKKNEESLLRSLQEVCDKSAEELSRIEKEKGILEALISEKEATISGLESRLDTRDHEVTMLNESMRTLQLDVDSKTADIDGFNSRIEAFEIEMAASRRRIEDLEADLLNEAEKFEQKSVEQLESARDASNKHAQETESLKNELADKSTSLSELEAKHAKFEKMFEDVRISYIAEKKERDDRIEELEEQLSRQIEESGRLVEDAERRLATQSRLAESLEAELRTAKKSLNETEKKVLLAEQVTRELTAQTMGWQEEKNVLLERCLSGESDLDFERERALENKRRFDEALSAMYELGRANQSLQMDMDKFTSRKWLDDSAAVNCTDCGKMFSLTVRKHHCRVCGLIYCSQCSSHSARLPSSKTPVRACNHCYTDMQNR